MNWKLEVRYSYLIKMCEFKLLSMRCLKHMNMPEYPREVLQCSGLLLDLIVIFM